MKSNWLSKLVKGQESSIYIKHNVNGKPCFEFHGPSAFISHTQWTWTCLKFQMSIRIFQAGAFIHVHFCDKLINFLLPFPVLFCSFMKAKSQTFIFVVGHNRERGEIEAVKKRFVIVKNSTQSFFPCNLFSVLKTNSIKIFEIFLKNKPVSNDIYNEVVELNPSLLYMMGTKSSKLWYIFRRNAPTYESWGRTKKLFFLLFRRMRNVVHWP